MLKAIRCKFLLPVLFIFALLTAGIVSGHQGHSLQSLGSTTNSAQDPLIEEMTALDSAFRDIVSAIALGNNEQVRKALESMHGAMEKTHVGIHAGTVTLRKNASRIKEFIERDQAFHEKLEALDRAARHENEREMLRITKQLLDGCVQCHQRFRP